jgi:hypothetical protein
MTTRKPPTRRTAAPTSITLALLFAAATVACSGDAEVDSDSVSAGDSDSDSAGDSDSDSDGGEDVPLAGERITGIGVGGGPDELTYAGLGSEEEEVWGPAAFVIDERGHNWLADGPGHKLLVIDDDGAIVDRYDLDGLVRGVADIEVTATHVYVLTVGGDSPVIARTGRHDVASSAWETFDLPEGIDGRMVTGLRQDAAGAVTVEIALGREHLALFAADGGAIAAPGAPTAIHQVAGRSVEVRGYRGEPGGDPTRGVLLVDGVEVASVTTAGMLGGFSLLGTTADDHLWIRVADVAFAGEAIQTRSLAYRFALDGTLVQLVEMPMDDQLVWVEHRLTIEPDGDLRVLSTGADEASLRRPKELGITAGPLPPRPGTTPYLPKLGVAEPPPPVQGDDAAPRNLCMSREEIMQRAYEYANYEAVYNQAHMKGCSGRTPVAYFQNRLGQPIRGVAYKYAGHIEVSTYHDAVANNYTVGDLNTKTDKVVDGCSYGVDCSGFVSKAWRSGHYATATLHNVSHNTGSYDDLKPGDALNKPGSHVRLVAENLWADGVKVVEATVGQERMRVIVRDISWESAGYAEGYAPVRYNNVCPDVPPPPPPTTTHVIFDASGYLPASSGYTPVGPARVLDTRVDGQEHVGPLATDETIAITVAGKAGLPQAKDLGAVVLNVAVAQNDGQGFAAVYPDAPYPGNSTVNFAAGQTTAGLTVVDPGDDGKIELHHITTGTGSQIVVDAFGYFPPSADLTMITPTRVFDSREAKHGGKPLAAGTTDLQLAGVDGIAVDGIGAVLVNLAVVQPADDGFATLFEAGAPQPTTSNLNYAAGTARANMVILPLSEKGLATLYTLREAHYVVDVLGWFGGAVDFEPIAPIRLRDTRADDLEPVGHDQSITIDVTSAPTIPADAVAVLGTLTAAAPTSQGYLQVYADALPETSSLNFTAGGAAANAVISKLSAAGQIHVRAIIPTP